MPTESTIIVFEISVSLCFIPILSRKTVYNPNFCATGERIVKNGLRLQDFAPYQPKPETAMLIAIPTEDGGNERREPAPTRNPARLSGGLGVVCPTYRSDSGHPQRSFAL
jgi:hypothetical protein